MSVKKLSNKFGIVISYSSVTYMMMNKMYRKMKLITTTINIIDMFLSMLNFFEFRLLFFNALYCSHI